MSSKRVLIAAAVVTALVSSGGQAWGQASGPITGNTLWHFLGIPQGFNKVYDDSVNRNGNRPGLERRGPVRSITDPSNLDPNTAAGQNPAIAKAAEIKQQEDLKKQKIKAIKYLATVGCCCYKGVDEALMAAMDDCTEEVRYEAVKAVSEAGAEKKKHHGLCHLHHDGKGGKGGGCNCDGCDGNCCCSEEMSKKLAEIAYEKNDKCCWLESSERVREAAKEALRNCCPNNGPPPPPENIPRPGDIETRPMPPSIPETIPQTRPETRGVPTPAVPTPPPPGITPPPGPPMPPPPLKGPSANRMPRSAAPVSQARPRPIPAPAADDGPDCRFEANFNPRTDRVEDSRVAVVTPRTAGATPLPSSFNAQVLVKDDESLWDSPVEPTGAEAELGIVRLHEASAGAGVKRTGAPNELRVDRFDDSLTDNATRDSEAMGDEQSVAAPQRPNPERSDGLGGGRLAAVNQPALDNESRQLVHGRVAALDPRNRLVTLSFPRGYEPPVGALVKVNHTFLLGPALVGELRVIELKEGAVIAQPTSNLSFGKINRDDEVETWSAVQTSLASRFDDPN